MDIVFKNNRFEKECNNQRLLEKQHGKERAKRIRRRLDDLRAANVLEDMRNLPGRCHELLHDRSGQLSRLFGSPISPYIRVSKRANSNQTRWRHRLD